MTGTTYLDIFFDKLAAGAHTDEDLRLRAQAELREIQKQRPILLVIPGHSAWQVPYTGTRVRELMQMVELNDHERLERYVRAIPNAMMLVPIHCFDNKYYSEVVVA